MVRKVFFTFFFISAIKPVAFACSFAHTVVVGLEKVRGLNYVMTKYWLLYFVTGWEKVLGQIDIFSISTEKKPHKLSSQQLRIEQGKI